MGVSNNSFRKESAVRLAREDVQKRYCASRKLFILTLEPLAAPWRCRFQRSQTAAACCVRSARLSLTAGESGTDAGKPIAGESAAAAERDAVTEVSYRTCGGDAKFGMREYGRCRCGREAVF
jgi:hypothetical protein